MSANPHPVEFDDSRLFSDAADVADLLFTGSEDCLDIGHLDSTSLRSARFACQSGRMPLSVWLNDPKQAGWGLLR